MICKDFNFSIWAVETRSLTRFLLIAIIVAGIYCGLQLGQKEDPDFTFRVAIAEIIWPGASPKEVEKQVVSPLESYLKDLPNMRYIHSASRNGRASFTFYVKGDTTHEEISSTWYNMRKIFMDRRYLLPKGALGPFINDDYGDTFITLYAVSGDKYNLAQINNIAEKIKLSLSEVAGVKKVSIIGKIPEEVSLVIPTQKMHNMGLSLFSIASLINDHTNVVGSGSLDGKSVHWPIYTDTSAYSITDIKNIPFTLNNRTLHIKDVAKVKKHLKTPADSKIFFQGKPAVIIGIVMNDEENIINVGRNLSESVEKIKKNLPIGVDIETVTNQESSVRSYIKTFLYKLSVAVIIILMVTFFSLGIRTGFVVAISIPIVLAATFVVMHYMGISFQKISLGALIISLGLLVDDSVISAEMITHKLEEGWEIVKAVGHSYDTTAAPMLTGTLITIAGFIPIGMARSSAGEYVFSLFVVVAVSMLISWVVSIYFTPYIGYELLRGSIDKIKTKHNTISNNQNKVKTCVVWCLKNRYLVIISTILIFFLSCFALIKFVPQQFFPASNRPEIVIDLWGSPNSSKAQTEKIAKETESYLLRTQKIKDKIINVTTYVGQGAPRFYMPLDQQRPANELVEVIVLAKDIPSREFLANQIEHDLSKNLKSARFRVSLLNSGPPVGWPIQFRVSGQDHRIIRNIVSQVCEIIKSDKNTYNVFDDSEIQTIAIRFNPDQERLRALGVSMKVLQSTIKYITNGLPISELREGKERIAIILREYDPKKVISLNDLKSSYVQSENGTWIPLKDLGHWSLLKEQNTIHHRNGIETVTINAQTKNINNINSIAIKLNEEMDKIRENIPSGYSITAGGSFEESKISQKSVYVNLPVFILLTILLLMIHLKDFEKSVLVYVTAPLGIIGSTLSLIITNRPFGFVSLLGIIALAGMIMRNSIILIDQIDQDIGDGIPIYNAIIDSTVRRFRPIVLTAAAAVLAFVPLSFNLFWGPMAVALIGGLTIATVLTITFLPALYAAWFNVNDPDDPQSGGTTSGPDDKHYSIEDTNDNKNLIDDDQLSDIDEKDTQENSESKSDIDEDFDSDTDTDLSEEDTKVSTESKSDTDEDFDSDTDTDLSEEDTKVSTESKSDTDEDFDSDTDTDLSEEDTKVSTKSKSDIDEEDSFDSDTDTDLSEEDTKVSTKSKSDIDEEDSFDSDTDTDLSEEDTKVSTKSKSDIDEEDSFDSDTDTDLSEEDTKVSTKSKSDIDEEDTKVKNKGKLELKKDSFSDDIKFDGINNANKTKHNGHVSRKKTKSYPNKSKSSKTKKYDSDRITFDFGNLGALDVPNKVKENAEDAIRLDLTDNHTAVDGKIEFDYFTKNKPKP
ncbi:efflux RND transporter permease subunit [Candidatus Ichthyocystis sparus]|uniref:efflux RND transporter permease subunit n=2 Tax=Candidatus Ichthyocystis sparus TaxID=1561004 RepID=UPI000A3EDDB9|nr:efflux RND transporter permease subunit [Candidatus Ichthyocystis sparus]